MNTERYSTKLLHYAEMYLTITNSNAANTLKSNNEMIITILHRIIFRYDFVIIHQNRRAVQRKVTKTFHDGNKWSSMVTYVALKNPIHVNFSRKQPHWTVYY